MNNSTSHPNVLPSLTEGTIASMESVIFDRIDATRLDQKARSRRKRKTTVLWTAAAATALVGGVAVGPALVGAGSASSDSYDSAFAPASGANGEAFSSPEVMVMDGSTEYGAERYTAPGSSLAPQVITTASLTLTVDDVKASAAEITALSAELSGYVSSQTIGSDEYRTLNDRESAEITAPTYGWVTIRVPEAAVDQAIEKLSALGSVTATTIDRYDVTQDSVDLQARVDSLTTSVARLEELMKQSGSVADLVTAESALSERQAELESLQQQLNTLADQVAMSTVTVSLATVSAPVDANPSGFGDGLLAGWHGLIAAFNGIVLALGFALPWVVVIGIAALIVWLIVRARRRSAAGTAADTHRPAADFEG